MKRVIVLAVGALVLQGCTDLSESPFSLITPSNFYQNEEEVTAGLVSLYAQFASVATGNPRNLQLISSDEQVIPTRGQDWYDNGAHLEHHRQLWRPSSVLGVGTINSAWNAAYTGVARANILLEAIEPIGVANKARIVAEARALRAYFYLALLDMFGGVPIVTDTEIKPRERASAAETFAFIEKELEDVRNALPVSWPSGDYGRITQGAVDGLLTLLYLNAGVYTAELTPGGLQGGQSRWADALAAADRVLAGPYSLNPDWVKNFTHDNDQSPEMVLVINRLPQSGVGFNVTAPQLHYNQFSPTPPNGRAVQPDFYRRFDPDDQRREHILEGPQFHLVTGAPVNDRAGARLIYTIDIADVTQATEGEGTRVYKFKIDPNRSGSNHGNDYPVIRLAEIILAKAEALNELGRTDEAIPLINQIRARVFDPEKPLPAGLSQAEVRQAIFDERAFEFFDEGKRRTDLIRAGQYTQAWFAKEEREPYRVRFPIPQTQIDANPLLMQNAGY